MNLQEEKTLNLFDFWLTLKVAFRRNWVFAVAPAITVVWLSILVAVIVPDYFVADCLIVVQPQRLTSEVIKAEDESDIQDRMETLLQTVLSKSRLREIVRRFNLYPELWSGADLDRAIAKFRKAIEVNRVQSATGNKGLDNFRIAFTYRNPDIVFQVTSKLRDLFLNESKKDAKSEVEGQLNFLEAQLTDARKQLEANEDLVQKFVRENFGQLPDDLNAAIARLESSQTRLATNSEMISANSQRKEHLQRELRELKAMPVAVAPISNDGAGDSGDSLQQLEQALVVLSSRYSDKHPDVIRTKQRISALKQQLKQSGGGSGKTAAVVMSSERVQQRDMERQINELEVSIAGLQSENKRLKETADELENSIKVMPLKEQELIKIKRDYSNKKTQYDSLLKAKKDLELKNNLMFNLQDTRFNVIEHPEKPFQPTGPKRVMIAGIGGLLAVVLFFSLSLGATFVSPAIKRKEQVEDELGLKVLGVIPSMETVHRRGQKRRQAAISVTCSAAILFIGGVSLLIFVDGSFSRFRGMWDSLRNEISDSQPE